MLGLCRASGPWGGREEPAPTRSAHTQSTKSIETGSTKPSQAKACCSVTFETQKQFMALGDRVGITLPWTLPSKTSIPKSWVKLWEGFLKFWSLGESLPCPNCFLTSPSFFLAYFFPKILCQQPNLPSSQDFRTSRLTVLGQQALCFWGHLNT